MADFIPTVLAKIESSGFTDQIAYPGIKFDPANLTQWIEVDILENGFDDFDTENDGQKTERGILQISAVCKPGSGIVILDALAKTIQTKFPKGTILCDKIRVTKHPYRMDVITTDDRLIMPVSINYSA